MSVIVAAVGDIHGCKGQLEELLALIRPSEGQRLVFLGDYVDIGPDSKGVIDVLLQLQSKWSAATFLLGNHEVEMLRFIQTGDFPRYAQQGGLATIRSYCGVVVGNVHEAFVDAVPKEHLKFLSTLELYFETPEYFFSHAGFDPDEPNQRTLEALVTASHDIRRLKSGLSQKTVVCGHYFQKSGVPAIHPRFIGIDTGCGTLRGPLTGLLIPSREFRQAPLRAMRAAP